MQTAESVRWAVSRLSTRLRAEQPGPGALTRVAASVLANLRHAGPATITGLAEVEGLQPQSLTRTVHSLERDGHVRRERDDTDGRAHRISITTLGRTALDEHVAAGNRWLATAVDRVLTTAERRVLDVAAELLMAVADHDVPETLTPAPRPRTANRPSNDDLPAAPL